MKKLVEKNASSFDNFIFNDFISLMNDYKQKVVNEYNDLFKKIDENKFLLKYEGYINLKVEIYCDYYENKLDDLLHNDKNNEIHNKLKDLLKEEKNLRSNFKVNNDEEYEKYVLNCGRLHYILGEIKEAEKDIHKAIYLLDKHDNSDIDTYNHYKMVELRFFSVKTFYENHKIIEKTEESIKNLNETKLDNYKVISVISGAIAFLIAGIQAFEKLTNVKEIASVMIMYAGILATMQGIILLSFSIIAKRKWSQYVVAGVVIAIGIGIFVFSLWGLGYFE